MSFSEATFAREKPTPRSFSSAAASRSSGVGKSQRDEPAENRVGRLAGELLMSDGPDQRLKRRARFIRLQPARADAFNEPAEPAIRSGQVTHGAFVHEWRRMMDGYRSPGNTFSEPAQAEARIQAQVCPVSPFSAG